MQRKNRGGEESGDTWLNTYADMVTLLLTFFAVLLSMSTVNEEKFNAFIRSFSNLSPEVIEEIIAGTEPDPSEDASDMSAEEINDAMNDLYQQMKKYINENNMQDVVNINMVDDVIYIRFDSSLFFAPDKSEMLPGANEIIEFIGGGVKQYENIIKLIAICGHTATVSNEYPVDEWLLSSERAGVVASYLDKDKNFDRNKLRTIGFGNSLPIASNDTEEGRAKNRRVELAIVGLNSEFVLDASTGLSSLYGETGDKFSQGQNDYSEEASQAAGKTEGAENQPTVEPILPEPDAPKESANSGTPSDVQVGVSPYD